MDAPEVRLAGRLGAEAHLSTIELAELSWHVCPTQGMEVVGLTTELAVECEPGYLSNDSLTYVVSANLKATFPSGQDLFVLKCHHVVGFMLPPDLDPGDEELAAYGKVTTVPLVMPYLRSLVTDITARAGLPPLVLDTVRIPLPGRPTPLDPLSLEPGTARQAELGAAPPAETSEELL